MTLPPIFQFIKNHQLPIATDIEKTWFRRVWIPLTMLRISCQFLLGQSDDMIPPTMPITSDVLDFLDYEERECEKWKNFKGLVELAEVQYNQIRCDYKDADEHIRQDGLQPRCWNNTLNNNSQKACHGKITVNGTLIIRYHWNTTKHRLKRLVNGCTTQIHSPCGQATICQKDVNIFVANLKKWWVQVNL